MAENALIGAKKMSWLADMVEICIIRKEDNIIGMHFNPLIKMCTEEPAEAEEAILALSEAVQKHNAPDDTAECFILGALFWGYKTAMDMTEKNRTHTGDIGQLFPVAAKCMEYLKNNGWFREL